MRFDRRLLLAWTLAVSVCSVHCTASSTSVTAPSAAKCEVAVSSNPTSFTHNGGAGSLTVATARDCTWAVTSDASWVSLSGASTGQGGAAVPYAVAVNPAPAARTAAISIGPQRVQLNQSGAPCRFELNPTRADVAAGGGRLSFGVTTLIGCSWSASSTVSWIAIVSGQSGNATANVALSVAANLGQARVGHVNIGGQTYTVAQSAASSQPSPPAPSPQPPSPEAPGGASVDFKGRVSALAGNCPDVRFVAAGRTVTAERRTDFRDGGCRELSNGDRVRVRGRQSGSTVAADRIDIEDDDDD